MTLPTRNTAEPAAHEHGADYWTKPIPRLTEEEAKRALAALERAREFRQRLFAKRGGVVFPESWPLIREAREER